jgi:branched-chain amino acid aminotransferase
MRWSGKAKEMGYGITLHLDSKTRSEIEEFSTSGFIGVKRVGVGEEEGVVMVVPDSENALRSVTSESCVEIARSWGWKVEIRAVSLGLLLL